MLIVLLQSRIDKSVMELKDPRWKGEASSDTASANPMSKIICELRCSLVESRAQALISGYDVLLQVNLEQANLLDRACFGCHIDTAEEDERLFQLDFEEAFYLSHEIKCLTVTGEDKRVLNLADLWQLMKSRKNMFPIFYKAYAHLRRKNWVVRSGAMYGADFVVYCHHPALVHSHYSAIVLTEGDCCSADRLKLWSNWEGMVRLSGSVAKALLLLHVSGPLNIAKFPSCLCDYEITEHIVTRWNPERNREHCPSKR